MTDEDFQGAIELLEGLLAARDELARALETAVDHLENSAEYLVNHGVHSDTVEARKMLDRLRG